MHALTIARFTIHEAVSRRLVLSAAILSLLFLGLYVLGFGVFRWLGGIDGAADAFRRWGARESARRRQRVAPSSSSGP